MTTPGTFYGVGVGPGERGLLPVVAWEAVQRCDQILAPRARTLNYSAARRALPDHQIPESRFREIEFLMDSDRTVLTEHYFELARSIARDLQAGQSIAYLTLGDPLTYSTYIYTLHALLEIMPELRYRTFPGITSYGALAAATDWPLGEGRETVLILPCPDDLEVLRSAIADHDVVILMKIAHRISDVLALLSSLGILSHCAYGHRVGMPESMISRGPAMTAQNLDGYLATLLIRRTARRARHHSPYPSTAIS